MTAPTINTPQLDALVQATRLAIPEDSAYSLIKIAAQILREHLGVTKLDNTIWHQQRPLITELAQIHPRFQGELAQAKSALEAAAASKDALMLLDIANAIIGQLTVAATQHIINYVRQKIMETEEAHQRL
jgi:hypothetical protein